jgi:hypothetical protein
MHTLILLDALYFIRILIACHNDMTRKTSGVHLSSSVSDPQFPDKCSAARY